ncbi:hypothetical protein WUBG_15859, partial [Wuchereria bancrofti]
MKAHEVVKTYELNQIYNVELLNFDGDKGRWLAVTESRSENTLYRSGTDIEIGSEVQAFVTSTSDDAHVFVEVSPGVSGCVVKNKKLSLKPDDLIKVRVNHIFPDGGLKVEFVNLIAKSPMDE